MTKDAAQRSRWTFYEAIKVPEESIRYFRFLLDFPLSVM